MKNKSELYFTPYVDPSKKLFILIGTCVTPPIRRLLALHKSFGQEHSIVVYNSHRGDKLIEDLSIDMELLGKADVIAYHHPDGADWGNEAGYSALVSGFPKSAIKITFPYPSFVPFWPFHTHEPRNEYENLPMNHYTSRKNLYPFGDSFVHGLMREEVAPEDILKRYIDLDISNQVDLDALFQTNLNIQRKHDKQLTIKIADFVEENYVHKKLFNSINHISNRTVLYIVNKMLELTGHEKYSESCLDNLLEWVRPEVPIHPSIIKHFDLQFVNAQSRYTHFGHSLTFEEYMYNYIHFL